MGQLFPACTPAWTPRGASSHPIAPFLSARTGSRKFSTPAGPSGGCGPESLTAQEKAEQEQQAKREIEERGRQAGGKRRDRALLTRYPTRQVHDKERQEAISGINVVIQAAALRLTELINQQGDR